MKKNIIQKNKKERKYKKKIQRELDQNPYVNKNDTQVDYTYS